MEFGIIWNSYYGLIVPLEAIEKEQDINYVTVIKYMDYVKVPIKIRIKNDGYAIVKNLEDAELEELNIKREYNIRLHDRIIIE